MSTTLTVTNVSPSTGSVNGGNVVTITGTGFTGMPQLVTFGGTNASSIKVISETELQVTAPANGTAGEVPVQVSLNGNVSPIATTAQYTYSGPAITGLSVNTGSLGGNTEVTITGTCFTGASGVNFGNTGAMSFKVVSDTEITTVSPVSNAAGAVFIKVSVIGLLSDTTSSSQFTYTIPEVSSVSANEGPLTGGTAVTITGQYFTGASGVSFGTPAAASFNVVSDTEITAVSPVGVAVGSVDITITVEGQTSATSTNDTFTYQAPPPLQITFTNDTNSNVPDAQILIGFFDGTAPSVPSVQPTTALSYSVPNATFSITNNNDGTAIQPVQLSADFATGGWPDYGYPFNGNWYSLAELSKGVAISNFSGRIYVTYATLDSNNNPISWQFPSVANGGWGYTPNSAGTDSVDFFIRYDQMELTFNGSPDDVADLTSINFWSIPMTLSTSLKDAPVASVTGTYNGATPQSILDALTTVSSSSIVPGSFTAVSGVSYLVQPPCLFARVIGPVSYPPVAPPTFPYDNFSDYLTYLNTTFGPGTTLGTTIADLGNGVVATISGKFAGSAAPKGATDLSPYNPQTYTLTASIDSNCDITLSGTVGSASVTMLFTNADLTTPPGIYGGNVDCTITPLPYSGYPAAPGNDVYGWVAGDLFLGFNIGAIGSTQTLEGATTMVGAMNSQSWYTLTELYQNLQSNPSYYDQWSAAMQPLSQAYNFAYSDRLKNFAVQIKLAPGLIDTLNISLADILNDSYVPS
jgi:hypothetical protein